jgi:hypothetical protein
MFRDDIRKNYHGKCFTDDKARKLFVEIPKCGSQTFTGPLFRNKGYKDNNWNTNPEILDYEYFAIIRNPLQRWIKSTVELMFHHYEHSKSFDNVRNVSESLNYYYNFDDFLDLHHVPQYCFLEGLKEENLTLCKLEDKELKNKFNQFFDISFEYPDRNVTSNIEEKSVILDMLNKVLDIHYADKIYSFYKKDFELWDTLN